MAYQSLEDIIKLCEEKDIPFWEAILQDDINERTIPVEESYDKMREMWHAMLRASEGP